MNQTNIENVKKALQITLAKYDRNHIKKAIYKILKFNQIAYITRAHEARNIISKMSYEELRDAILYIFSEFIGIKIDRENALQEETLLLISNTIGDRLPKNYILSQGEVFNIKERRDNMDIIPIAAKLSGCDGLDYKLTQSRQIGNMQIASSQGIVRPNQEDAGIIMQHPRNPNFKMLVVADGMGGHSLGEKASDYLVNRINEWFNSLPIEFYENRFDLALQNALQGKINEISNNINNLYRNGGTTFLSAIVRDKDILIASVGDSIAYGYRYKDNRFGKLNVDDSYVSELYREGYLPEVQNEDDLRFNIKSNKILSCIGGGVQNPQVHFSSVPPDFTIVLCSDGVSDCISMDLLKNVLGAFRTSKEGAAEAIVNIATDRNRIEEKPEYLRSNPNYKTIYPGKDNATVAIYDDSEERT